MSDEVDVKNEEDPQKEILDFKTRIEELENEIMYANAEIANTRQRAARDRSEAIRYGGSSLIRRILPMLDSLEKAIHSSKENDSKSIIEGVRMTLMGIKSSLELEGIIPIDTENRTIDPTCMEAIATVPTEKGKKSGTVVDVIEQGYMYHDRVLRASRVIVYEGEDEE